ncbi:pteridine reductase [Oryzomicrobium sp.]|uniref:pteridine reductase n=1 Tax=Oryzomicrobium sp. TaxID=1911578 RepID=UPI0025E5339E|nr:pteridine reductase [Oryzomicrobium sp.]MCE1242314.1 pteridine reductase [Oryzomicrobium sp.]
MHELAGKVVLVTGAARRVGEAIARRLHGAGATVALHYRHAVAEAQALAAEFEALRPGSAACLQADLLDTASLPGLVDGVLERFGRLDGLVNNASSFFPTPLGEITEAAWDDLVGSNFKAPLFLTQAAAPALAASRGAVVNITDIHAERPLAGYALYCAAKGALLTLTRALAVELGPAVRVNAVAPGPILWPEGDDFPAAARQAIVDHTLLKREGSPDDIARAVCFLLAEATYVTGQVINVDGGRSAHL